MIQQGGTIGILGGGQLGRMLSMAAAALGYRVHIFAPEQESVAGDVSALTTRADWTDEQALADFANRCDVVTLEFENVPVAPLSALKDKIAPPPRALEIAQDRLKEKRFVEDLGGRPAPYAEVDSRASLREAMGRIGTPGILKTRRDGYDGKGQWRLGPDDDGDSIDFPEVPAIYEGLVDFAAEFSVIIVRGRDGEKRFWDSSHNEHSGGILARSSLPPPDIVLDQAEAARTLAARVADALDYVGVLTLEFFATAEGPVFNEMAPRVHNSGHWTIEGAATSQFENHIRAICGLPLGDTATVARAVTMDNIIGRAIDDAFTHLARPDTHVHIYGKKTVREGRKMAHVTQLER